MKKELCQHKDYIPAGYKDADPQGVKRVRVQSMYEVFCLECKNYIHLLNGKIINNQGLVHIDHAGVIG